MNNITNINNINNNNTDINNINSIIYDMQDPGFHLNNIIGDIIKPGYRYLSKSYNIKPNSFIILRVNRISILTNKMFINKDYDVIDFITDIYYKNISKIYDNNNNLIILTSKQIERLKKCWENNLPF